MDTKFINFHRGIGDDDLLKFHPRIYSDIEELASQIGQNGELITTRTIPHVLLAPSVLKRFLISLEPEEGEAAAKCAVFFVNSALAKRRLVLSREELASKMTPEVADDIFDTNTTEWLLSGTNFVSIPHIYISTAYKGNSFMTWMVARVPEFLSDIYGLSFQKVVVPFRVGVADGDLERHPDLVDDELGCRRLVNQKKAWLREIMENLGYEEVEDSDMDRIVFYLGC